MKKTIITITFLIAGLIGFSQNNAIDKFYSAYSESEDFTKITISAKMFELFAYLDADSPEDQEVLNTIKNLSGMKMLVQDSIRNGKNTYKSALEKPSKDYEVLMTVDDNDEDITFFINEKDGVVNELLLIGGGDDNFFILSLYGVIDLKQISKLAKAVNIQGLEHLDHVDEK